jgi:hypothetical protein
MVASDGFKELQHTMLQTNLFPDEAWQNVIILPVPVLKGGVSQPASTKVPDSPNHANGPHNTQV